MVIIRRIALQPLRHFNELSSYLDKNQAENKARRKTSIRYANLLVMYKCYLYLQIHYSKTDCSVTASDPGQ